MPLSEVRLGSSGAIFPPVAAPRLWVTPRLALKASPRRLRRGSRESGRFPPLDESIASAALHLKIIGFLKNNSLIKPSIHDDPSSSEKEKGDADNRTYGYLH
jgi:hypothetical protein